MTEGRLDQTFRTVRTYLACNKSAKFKLCVITLKPPWAELNRVGPRL